MRTPGDYALLMDPGVSLSSREECFEAIVDVGVALIEGEGKRSVPDNQRYLAERLSYRECVDEKEASSSKCVEFPDELLLDGDGEAVMAEWEKPLMEAHAKVMCEDDASAPELSVLNVGFGLGIIDRMLQERRPSHHSIIEAHEDVLARMESEGWGERSGVMVHKGRWQDVWSQIGDLSFDGVMFDTYAEDYLATMDFIEEICKRGLLSTGGLLTFFNGMGSYDLTSYIVMAHVMARHIAKRTHFTVRYEWRRFPFRTGEEDVGQRARQWALDGYLLPVVYRPAAGAVGNVPGERGVPGCAELVATVGRPGAKIRVARAVGS